jgi:hypothetical protein
MRGVGPLSVVTKRGQLAESILAVDFRLRLSLR